MKIFSIILIIIPILTACAATPEMPGGSSPTEYKPAGKISESAYAKYMYGVFLRKEGRKGEAIKNLEEASRFDTTSESIRMELLGLYMETGQKRKAEEAAKEIISINPDNPDAHISIGRILADRKEFDRAAVHFEKTIELVPDKAGPYIYLAEIYGMTGKTRPALKILKNLAKKPEHA
jgi:tetratricopeptide (TPR) repeat protein